MEQNLWLDAHRFSFWYWKLGETVKRTTLYIWCFSTCTAYHLAVLGWENRLSLKVIFILTTYWIILKIHQNLWSRGPWQEKEQAHCSPSPSPDVPICILLIMYLYLEVFVISGIWICVCNWQYLYFTVTFTWCPDLHISYHVFVFGGIFICVCYCVLIDTICISRSLAHGFPVCIFLNTCLVFEIGCFHLGSQMSFLPNWTAKGDALMSTTSPPPSSDLLTAITSLAPVKKLLSALTRVE